MPTAPWWERFPGRLEYEIQSLEAAGYAPVVDTAAKEKGLARVALTVPVDGIGDVAMTATYPDHYPYFRPEVAAPTLDLGHHQNPFSKHLCLVGRSTANWSTTDTLAGLLDRQAGSAVASGAAAPDPGQERDTLPEERQAEPYGEYYTYAPSAMVLIDGSWQLPAGTTHGSLTIRVRGPLPPVEGDPEAHTLAVVTEIRSHEGDVIAAAAGQLAHFPGRADLRARWSRVPAPVASNDPRELWEAAAAADPGGDPPSVSSGKAAIQVRALLFPEEVAWRESGEGWLFLVRQPGTAVQVKPSKKRGIPASTRQTPEKHWLLRAGRAGQEDFAARTPALRGLAGRRVTVVGAGALGGTVAVQLARAGVGALTTIDGDTLEPGNTVRHAAPFMLSGRPKAAAVAAVAADRSPYVESGFMAFRLGVIRNEAAGDTDVDALEQALARTDLLVDATAELGVQHLLADEAARLGIPYLCVTATNGAWGGMVTLITPGQTAGCWLCLQYHLADGTIPTPPEDPGGFVQPAGCADPTFTRAGFDLDQVALHAVRVAVAELLRSSPGGYPAPPHDVAVLALREPDGTPTLPSWTGHTLTRHPNCATH